MLKLFYVHEEGKEPVAHLLYDTDTEEFTLRLLPNANRENVTAFMYFMIENGRSEVTDDLAMCFVRERLVPPERANIA